MVRSYVVIPARLASTRLPRKLLLRETGKTVLQHTCEAAQTARLPQGVCVAADHDEIAQEVRSFGGQVVMTSPDAASGTDRIAEVASTPLLSDVDIVVNVQGDEPEISGEAIDLVAQLLIDNPSATMATLATPIRSRPQLEDPNCVKVVFGHGQVQLPPGTQGGKALYFSRSQIPYARQWHDHLLTQEPSLFYQHLGIYAYRREFLLQLGSLRQTPLEQLESLEQLRVLENGHTILVGVVQERSIGIDTLADYQEFVARFRHSG